MGSCPTSGEPLVQTLQVATYMPSFRDAPFDFKEVEIFGKEKPFTHCMRGGETPPLFPVKKKKKKKNDPPLFPVKKKI